MKASADPSPVPEEQAVPKAALSSPEPVLVGVVRRPYGQGGEVRVDELSDYPQRFAPGAAITIAGAAFVIARSRRVKRVRVLKLNGVDTREAAAALANQDIHVAAAELQPLPEGVYYHYDLIGMAVETADGAELGEVTEIVATGANDVIVVQGEGGEVLAPLIADVVKRVDTAARRLVIDPPPGLI